MRVFVTGGAGYVGSHCVKQLVAAGHLVTVFDNLSLGHAAAVDARAQLVRGDLADAALVRRLLVEGGYDAVMHFAGATNVGESVENPLLYYRNNVANTIHLLEAMRDAGVLRLVFSSTCAVYGVPDELPLVESMPKDPISPYGRTKLAVEWLLADSATAWGLGAVALRYFNASGAAADGTIGEDHRPETHLIPIVLQTALGQRPCVRVFGTDYPTADGSCVRDYIHVEDLASAHQLALEQLAPGKFEAFNVGTGAGHSVLEVIAAARRITGRQIAAETTERRSGDPPALFADAEKLNLRFGWLPHYRNLDQIVRSAWSWHVAHPHGFAER